LSFDHIEFDYEPYPIGLAKPALPTTTYAELVQTFPAIALFRYKQSKGEKYSLSQYNNRDNYRRFVKTTPAWRQFHSYIQDTQVGL